MGTQLRSGGSKEAFHLVYQALQTLTDPAARKKHDKSLAHDAATSMANPGLVQSEPKPKKKSGGRDRRDALPPQHRNQTLHTHSRQPQDRLEGLKRLRVVKEAHPNSRNPSKGSFY